MRIWNNFTLKWKPIIFIYIGFSISSCNSEDLQEFNENQIAEATQKTTLKELGYSSYEEMLHDGWEELPEKEKKILYSVKEANKIGSLKVINEKITAEHLKELGYNSYANYKLINLFYKSGIRPEGICINDFKTVSSYNGFLLSDRYGWYTYIKTEEPKILKQTIDTLWDNELASTWAINTSYTQADRANLNYTFTKSETAYWENMGSLAVCVGGEVGIPFVAKGKVDITLGYTHVEGRSKTTSESFGYTYWVELPIRTKRQIIIKKKKIVKTLECEIPVSISGLAGANYSRRVDGHYFWGLPANILLKDKPKSMTYQIKVDQEVGIDILGGPEIALNENDIY